jgi:hypothetical protein
MPSIRTQSDVPDVPAESRVPLLFDTVVTDLFEREHILQLGAGVSGAVHIRDFFDLGQCAEIMKNLESCTMGSYDERVVQPRVSKLGPAAFDYYHSTGFQSDYWEHVEESVATRAGLLADADPIDVAKAKLARAWGGPVRELTAGGKPLFAGMIREVNNGGGIHFDDLAREFPGSADHTLVTQLAFNCHLSMPESGGELNVFRRRWEPADEASRGAGYFYPDVLLAGEHFVSVLAGVGDAVIFDPRNYHRIRPGAGAGRRVTLSFFVGIPGTGELVLWS